MMDTSLCSDLVKIDSLFSPALSTNDDQPNFLGERIAGTEQRWSTQISNQISTTDGDNSVCIEPSVLVIGSECTLRSPYDFGCWKASTTDNVPSSVQKIGYESGRNWLRAHPQQPFINRTPSHRQQHCGELTPPHDLPSTTRRGRDEYVREGTSNTARKTSVAQSADSILATNCRSTKPSEFASGKSAHASKRCQQSCRQIRRPKNASSAPIDPKEAAKRERFLERNRVAASKCRRKKQEWVVKLQENERQQKALNEHLKWCVSQLKKELIWLKGECLRHSDCQCTAIREYLLGTISSMRRPSPTASV